jgi:hypothetical protein
MSSKCRCGCSGRPFKLILCFFALLAAAAPAVRAKPPNPAEKSRAPGVKLLPWQRVLAGDDLKKVESLEDQVAELEKAGKLGEAAERARVIADIRAQIQGADHWQTANAQCETDDLRLTSALPAEGRAALARSRELGPTADMEQKRGNYAESERITVARLEIQRKWFGEGHHKIADFSNNIAYLLSAQGKLVEAEPLYRKALEIYLKVLGAHHPNTATTYNNLGVNLDHQGRFAEAEPLHRKALAIKLEALGNDDPDTARGYNQLAFHLTLEGKHGEAEPLFRRALAIYVAALSRDDPRSATTFHYLAGNLDAQGNHAEAEPLHRHGLAVRLKALGRNHPYIAQSLNFLALNLTAQGHYAEAEALHRQAVAVSLIASGKAHLTTATSYNNLALNLIWQARYAEAEPLLRQALSGTIEALGANHPNVAAPYSNLAADLEEQGKYGEAEALHRKALAIRLAALGERHPLLGAAYNNLAMNLSKQNRDAEAVPLLRKALAVLVDAPGSDDAEKAMAYANFATILDSQGKLAEAVENWITAARILERTRGVRSTFGLEGSISPVSSPLPALALALARQGQHREAWVWWESDLARGLLDNHSARLLRPLSREERSRESDLAGQLQRLDERVTRVATKSKPTVDDDRLLDELKGQQSVLRGEWLAFQAEMERQYHEFAGKPWALEQIQGALPADTALLGWLDVAKHHWACIVRHQDNPGWVKISGSNPDGSWTAADEDRPEELRKALAERLPEWRAAAKALARQRIAPLLAYLKEVRHLVVLPSRALAGVPVEVLVEALSDGSPRPVISYASSGSMFARLRAPRSLPNGAPRLLAVGDPAFPKADKGRKPAVPPDHGIAIGAIDPHGTADLFGLKAGDTLLEYNGKQLRSASDLVIVPSGDKASRVPVKLWRDGEIRSLEIAAGPLGIKPSPMKAADAVLAQQAAALVLNPRSRGDNLDPLPGTRDEIEAIAALFPKDQTTTLLGHDATESNVQELARSGALKSYSFIHLATHGKSNSSVALSSALFFAAEPERAAGLADPATIDLAPDGRITAEQIVRTWDLAADLVVLSACETALGRYAGGEGYLGFSQALFVKGARSLVLSQWRAHDRATSLLMTRFYQNLLGRRRELSGPMAKADALNEAKAWLRGLTSRDVQNGSNGASRGDIVREPRAAAEAHPFEHPHYWAAFILMGDPT